MMGRHRISTAARQSRASRVSGHRAQGGSKRRSLQQRKKGRVSRESTQRRAEKQRTKGRSRAAGKHECGRARGWMLGREIVTAGLFGGDIPAVQNEALTIRNSGLGQQ